MVKMFASLFPTRKGMQTLAELLGWDRNLIFGRTCPFLCQQISNGIFPHNDQRTSFSGSMINSPWFHSCIDRVGSLLCVSSNKFICCTFARNMKPSPFMERHYTAFQLSLVAYSTSAAACVPFERDLQDEQFENSVGGPPRKSLDDQSLKLLSGSCYLPHPDKEDTGGEDAHFICDNERVIGVADGVGGWADLGINAGEYARELMLNSVSAVQDEPRGLLDPVKVLEKAYSNTKAKGSSTACIIALNNQGIRAVNLGDSGFIAVRYGSTIFRSPIQQHDFNFTYQLESGNNRDLPCSAQVFTFSVESGDVIVAGTDGLFDNLYNNEIKAILVYASRVRLGPQIAAQKIAALARQRAQDKNRQTPFSAAAQHAGFRYYGGKLDDITVLVSYITSTT